MRQSKRSCVAATIILGLRMERGRGLSGRASYALPVGWDICGAYEWHRQAELSAAADDEANGGDEAEDEADAEAGVARAVGKVARQSAWQTEAGHQEECVPVDKTCQQPRPTTSWSVRSPFSFPHCALRLRFNSYQNAWWTHEWKQGRTRERERERRRKRGKLDDCPAVLPPAGNYSFHLLQSWFIDAVARRTQSRCILIICWQLQKSQKTYKNFPGKSTAEIYRYRLNLIMIYGIFQEISTVKLLAIWVYLR